MPKSSAARRVSEFSTSHYVEIARKGGPEAFSGLIHRVHQRLYRFCLYLTRDTMAAQDLCQDAYLKIIENLDRYKDPNNFSAWMFTLTRNIFLDYVRSPKNKAKLSIDDTGVVELLKKLPGSEKIVHINQALKQLDAEERLLLLLVFFEGCSHAEAANVLGISLEAAHSRLRRSRNKFRSKYLSKNKTF